MSKSFSWMVCVLLAAMGCVAAEVGIDVAEYQPDRVEDGAASGAVRPVLLPAAFGIHRSSGDSGKWVAAWVRLRGPADTSVRAFVNRRFCAIGPERANQAAAPDPAGETFAMTGNWKWYRIPLTPRQVEYRFELVSEAERTRVDAMILTDDDKFDPSARSEAEIAALPKRALRTEPADRLFETNPLMSPREYAEEVARMHHVEPAVPVAMTDANGAPLRNGKPWFPMMIYHAWPNDTALDEVPLNVMSDTATSGAIPCPKGRQVSFWGKEFCYEDFFNTALGERQAGNAVIYLADEPDAVMDAVTQRRLHELVKVVVPGTPTLYVDCLFGNLPENFRTSDYAGFDHYPVGRSEDWFSIEVIGWIVDRMRWSSGNAPTIFVVQTFAWKRFLPHEAGGPAVGNFPSDRELAAMIWLPVACGVRGLYFFNYRDLYGDNRQTMPENEPEGWAQFTRLVRLLDSMKNALVGPEVALPWQVEGDVRLRILVSAARDEAYLVAVNPTLHDTVAKFHGDGGPLANATFEPVMSDGVTPDFADGRIAFQELGSAVYRIVGGDLAALRQKSTEEILRELEPAASSDAGPGPYLSEAIRLGRRGEAPKEK